MMAGLSGVAVLAAILAVALSPEHARAQHNSASSFEKLAQVEYHGRVAFINEDLIRKLEEEARTYHWTPWQQTRTKLVDNYVEEVACNDGSSLDSFPDGILTDDQLRNGGFLIYVFFGIYAFTLLAIVCNDYFLPSVEFICEDLKIPADVAAATFMAVATSCPEFFVNTISTFLTESDMGIGTIVGSALFNALAVTAIGGLAAIRPIRIEPRPVTRDVLIYSFNVSVLVAIVWDGQVDWWETVILATLYVLYFFVMFNSWRAFVLFDKLLGCCGCGPKEDNSTITLPVENGKPIDSGIDNAAFNNKSEGSFDKKGEALQDELDGEKNIDGEKQMKDEPADEEEPPKVRKSLWRYPSERTVVYRIWWVFSWPLKLILTATVPSPKTFRRWYPLSFIMCILWIGANSYLVTWCMSVIGFVFFIPDSIMGMTFLALGGCLPEATAIFIMSRKGKGGMGVSNALGANSLAILFALGMPWFIRCMIDLARNETATIIINSSGIDFIVASLLLAVAALWLTLFLGKFTLRKTTGFAIGALYIIFITFAILVESGVILNISVPLC